MLVITTAKNGHIIHRDTCPRIVPKVDPVDAGDADPQTVLDARPCSRCSPRPDDVGRAIADAEARRDKPAATATRKPRKATQDATGAVLPAEPVEVGTDTHQRCTGACGDDLPIQKFPTKAGGGRGTECRKCRDARRAAAKAR